jgi:hypothetical protein
LAKSCMVGIARMVSTVVPTAITKGCWMGMIIAGTKPKNNTRNYSRESVMKPNNNGINMVRIMNILRI